MRIGPRNAACASSRENKTRQIPNVSQGANGDAKLLCADEETRRFAKKAFKVPLVHCVYCGDWYQCRDHYIPTDWVGYKKSYYAGDVVPCCTECNNCLNNIAIFDIGKRAQYLIPIIEAKGQKWLRLPVWPKSELKEMGYTLRKQIEKGLMLREITIMRVKNLDLVSLGYEPIPIMRVKV